MELLSSKPDLGESRQAGLAQGPSGWAGLAQGEEIRCPESSFLPMASEAQSGTIACPPTAMTPGGCTLWLLHLMGIWFSLIDPHDRETHYRHRKLKEIPPGGG